MQRYQARKVGSPHAIWRFNHKCVSMPRGKRLRIEVLQPAMVHWSDDGWQTVIDSDTRDTGLGVHVVDLATHRMAAGTRIDFTFHWPLAGRWEGSDFRVMVSAR